MSACCTNRSPFVGHWVNNPRRIGGNFFRRVEKQVRRDVKNVGDAVASAAEHVEEQVKRDGRNIDQTFRRAGYSIADYYEGMVDEADQFIRQTGKHGAWSKIEAEFRRNPEAFGAVGSVLMMMGPPWMFIGAAIAAAAAVRIERNKRKLAESMVPPGADESTDFDTGGAGAALEWLKRNPLVALAIGVAVWQLLKHRRR